MKNIIFLVAINDGKLDYYRWAIKSWSDWANRNSIDLFVLDKPITDSIYFNKYKVFELLDDGEIEYDRILIVDADTLCNPEMPNIFDETEAGYFYGVRHYGSVDWMLRSIECYSDQVFHDVELDWEKYINAGVILVDKSHREFFKNILLFNELNTGLLRQTERLELSHDQTPLNFLLEHYKIKRRYLTYEWNMQEMQRFECLQQMLFTKIGYVYHFDGGIRPSVGRFMEHTYKFLKEKYE